LILLQIVTFDAGGITQHPNHIPLAAGVRALSRSSHPIRLVLLETVPKHIKFTGPLYPLGLKTIHLLSQVSFLADNWNFRTGKGSSLTITSTIEGYKLALEAMMRHKSQLVWFRWLYVGASKYMWSNTLVLAESV
jgi:N-acetylglucosaminylphosphatidylinositol deacetylase